MRETPHSIVNALKQRAQAVLNDRSIDAESRAIIRYALETNDPLLSEFVRRSDAGETIVDEAGYLNISKHRARSQPRCWSSCRRWKMRRTRKHSQIWRTRVKGLLSGRSSTHARKAESIGTSRKDITAVGSPSRVSFNH